MNCQSEGCYPLDLYSIPAELVKYLQSQTVFCPCADNLIPAITEFCRINALPSSETENFIQNIGAREVKTSRADSPGAAVPGSRSVLRNLPSVRVICAGAGTGKSANCSNIAIGELMRGKTVLWFDTEGSFRFRDCRHPLLNLFRGEMEVFRVFDDIELVSTTSFLANHSCRADLVIVDSIGFTFRKSDEILIKRFTDAVVRIANEQIILVNHTTTFVSPDNESVRVLKPCKAKIWKKLLGPFADFDYY